MSHIKPQRICIIGPSSSGKSTLAQELGRLFNYPVLHLDQIAHIPNTNWQRRPLDETIRLHNEFIKQDKWIVEGNYSKMMSQRFERADTVIFHRFNRFGCLYRFIMRALQKNKNRPGGLQGSIECIKLHMIHYILFQAPNKNKEYEELIRHHTHLHVIQAHTFQEINKIRNQYAKQLEINN